MKCFVTSSPSTGFLSMRRPSQISELVAVGEGDGPQEREPGAVRARKREDADGLAVSQQVARQARRAAGSPAAASSPPTSSRAPLSSFTSR